MNTLVKIDNNKNLMRDINSKAILNTDRNGLNEYLMKRELAKKQQAEKMETKERLTKLENDIAEIKILLQDISQMRKV